MLAETKYKRIVCLVNKELNYKVHAVPGSCRHETVQLRLGPRLGMAQSLDIKREVRERNVR